LEVFFVEMVTVLEELGVNLWRERVGLKDVLAALLG